jgi:hypothetical protein
LWYILGLENYCTSNEWMIEWIMRSITEAWMSLNVSMIKLSKASGYGDLGF